MQQVNPQSAASLDEVNNCVLWKEGHIDHLLFQKLGENHDKILPSRAFSVGKKPRLSCILKLHLQFSLIYRFIMITSIIICIIGTVIYSTKTIKVRDSVS